MHHRVLQHLINRWKFWPCRGVFFFLCWADDPVELEHTLERVTSPRSWISADEMAWCHSCRLNQTIVIITSDVPMASDKLRLSNSCSHVSFIAYNSRNTGWSWHQGSHYTGGQSDGSLFACFSFSFFSKTTLNFFAQGSRKKCQNYISASVLEVWRTETKPSQCHWKTCGGSGEQCSPPARTRNVQTRRVGKKISRDFKLDGDQTLDLIWKHTQTVSQTGLVDVMLNADLNVVNEGSAVACEWA